MLKRTGMLGILLLLMLGLLVLGCQGQAEEGEEDLIPPYQEADPGEKDPDFAGPLVDEEDYPQAYQALAAYLPASSGYRWHYEKEAKAGQAGEENGLVYELVEVFNRADGGRLHLRKADFTRQEGYDLAYTLEEGQWLVEEDHLDEAGFQVEKMVLALYPLEEGQSWQQTVKTSRHEALRLRSTITDIDDLGRLTIDYEDSDQDFYMRRVFSPGRGMLSSYVKSGEEVLEDLQIDPSSSGYAAERAAQAFLPPKDTILLYYGLAEYAHRAVLEEVLYQPRGQVYVVGGDFKYDGSGIEGTFRVDYQLDGPKGTLTEKVLENTRKEAPSMNSPLSDLIVLSFPLEEGKTWTQELSWQEEKKTMEARILKLTEEGKEARQVQVRYQIKGVEGYVDDTYFETRTFEEGRGLVGFTKLLPGTLDLSPEERENPDLIEEALANMQFGYGQNPLD